MKLERLKVNKNQKIIVSAIAGLLLVLVAITVIKNTFATNDAGYLETQIVENLEFSNGVESYENGIYTYEVEVTNTLNGEYRLSTIDVIFKDKEGNTIEELSGYLGDTIEANSKRKLSVSVDKEIKDIESISYVINK